VHGFLSKEPLVTWTPVGRDVPSRREPSQRARAPEPGRAEHELRRELKAYRAQRDLAVKEARAYRARIAELEAFIAELMAEVSHLRAQLDRLS
jgi:uncharacterized coiled-coil DUF342 family protein